MRGILVREVAMRRILPVLIGCILLAFPGFAQRGGGHGGGGGGMRGGGGGMRGGGSVGARGFSGGGFRGGGAIRGGGFRGGYRGIGGYRGRNGFRGYYGYPFYYSGLYGGFCDSYFSDCGAYGYGGDSGYGYPDYGGADYGGYPSYGAPSYSSPNPQVLIISNQTPPPPVMVQSPPAPSAWNAGPNDQTRKYDEPLFLLAMNDGTIRAVLAYWVDGATVHYVTMDHMQKQTPLASLDRTLSVRLNRERNVTFSLPG
jgi:hypothetical protein